MGGWLAGGYILAAVDDSCCCCYGCCYFENNNNQFSGICCRLLNGESACVSSVCVKERDDPIQFVCNIISHIHTRTYIVDVRINAMTCT